jgi:glycosyltransferase involved in cell wall biosynthesis
MRRERYAILHAHGATTAASIARLAARITNTPTIYHCRGTFYVDGDVPQYDRLLFRVYPFFEKGLARGASRVFTLNPTDAEDLIYKAGVPRNHVICLGVGGCGIDLDVWDAVRFEEVRKAQIRRELGVPDGKPIIGFVGRIVREKGILELIDAFSLVRDAGYDVHLLLVGDIFSTERDKETVHEVRRRIREGGLGPHVTLPGYLPEPAPAVAVMTILVFPSYREGFGQVVGEAGALGIPVIAATSRGTQHAIIDGQTGLLVPTRNPQALVRAMRRLLDDPQLAMHLGEMAVRRAREEFGRERVLETVVDVYRQLRHQVPSI